MRVLRYWVEATGEGPVGGHIVRVVLGHQTPGTADSPYDASVDMRFTSPTGSTPAPRRPGSAAPPCSR